MDAWKIFLWGFFGSMAVEIVEMAKFYYRSDFKLPFRYKLWHFYLLRLILASLGGGLAIAYGIEKPLLAANIGAATPLIIEALARNVGGAPEIDKSK